MARSGWGAQGWEPDTKAKAARREIKDRAVRAAQTRMEINSAKLQAKADAKKKAKKAASKAKVKKSWW